MFTPSSDDNGSPATAPDDAATISHNHRRDRDGRRRDDYGDVVILLRRMHRTRDRVKRGRIRDDAVVRALPLAEHIARRFAGRGEPFDDLLQVARLGLINAVDRFDVERGANFLAFAVPTVMGEVRRNFRDAMWSTKVPRRAKETSLRIGRAHDELAQHLGRSPSPSELADELDLEVGEVIEGLLADAAFSTASLDAPVASGEGRSPVETVGDDDEHYAMIDDFVSLRPALDELSERDRRILSLRFFGSLSQSEIADRIGMSQMHVSRLLSRILTTLRAEAGKPG